MLTYLNQCDRFRRTEEGERAWHEMMNTKREITEDAFLAVCDPSVLLDEGETWEEYKQAASSDPIRFYQSANGLYFFQTAGFEFIWGRK